MEESLRTVEIPPLPPAIESLPQIIKHITEMTEEEREAVLGDCKLARESYERCKREDGFNCKGDRCKEECEKKEKEEAQKKQMLETLAQRNELLEKHARKLETDFQDYKNQSEERFNKLATLIASLK
jgi:transcriptional regulator with GAF, ATPase, and Fis domain